MCLTLMLMMIPLFTSEQPASAYPGDYSCRPDSNDLPVALHFSLSKRPGSGSGALSSNTTCYVCWSKSTITPLIDLFEHDCRITLAQSLYFQRTY
jgi:hypothetical protein